MNQRIVLILFVFLSMAFYGQANENAYTFESEKSPGAILGDVSSNLSSLKTGASFSLSVQNHVALKKDLQLWIQLSGHKIVNIIEEECCVHFNLEKGYNHLQGKNLSIIAPENKEQLDNLLETARMASLTGMQAHIYLEENAVELLNAKKINRDNKFTKTNNIDFNELNTNEKLVYLKSLGAQLYLTNALNDSNISPQLHGKVTYINKGEFQNIIEQSQYHIIYDKITPVMVSKKL